MAVEQAQSMGRAYSAAELFHLPARLFNDALVKNLEKEGIQVFSPQRDGFEFSQLGPVLARHLPPEEVGKALNILIYAYDIKAIWESDVVISRFDEPTDPGVDTEVLFANAVGIPVIAYRTDVRSPYGNPSGGFRGMHSFPVQRVQALIIQSSSTSSEKDLRDLTEKIVAQVGTVLKNTPSKETRVIPRAYTEIFKIIDILFSDIDVHTEEGLTALITRYNEHLRFMDDFGPRLIS